MGAYFMLSDGAVGIPPSDDKWLCDTHEIVITERLLHTENVGMLEKHKVTVGS